MLLTPGGLVYGTILIASLLAAESARRETYPKTVAAVVLAIIMYWLALSYAEDVEHRAASGEHFSLRTFAHSALAQVPVLIGALCPLGVVLGCWVAGAPLESAIGLAVWVAAGVIALTEVALGLRTHLTGRDLLVQTAFGVLFGVAVVELRVLLH